MAVTVLFARGYAISYLAFIVIFQLACCITISEARRDIPDNNLSYPILISKADGSKVGSGFLYKDQKFVYLVTARHVLFKHDSHVQLKEPLPPFQSLGIPYQVRHRFYYDRNTNELIYIGEMSSQEKDCLLAALPSTPAVRAAVQELYGKTRKLSLLYGTITILSWEMKNGSAIPCEVELDLEKLNLSESVYYSPTHDAAIVKYAKRDASGGSLFYRFIDGSKGIRGQTMAAAIEPTTVKRFNDVLEGNRIFMFGYPTSITRSPHLEISKPLLRKGIVAGKNPILNTIVLDCPSFYGNSGGLVLEREDKEDGKTYFLAIGLVSCLVPFEGSWFENSGYSIAVSMDVVEELIAKGGSTPKQK